ncbi:MAG: sensor domain-containing diguanylate cyclase [Herbaspirillum huttiense]|uniref:sensor domain-containing diguanylate cyclase n=1 Tax=Herbaspirillum huttiense TaxID=863372 RepID=UPI001ACDCA08|nr:sensor domain-containing diguanylate cyclase [Herbaspirillum huttiense]MBN9357425.1 sensor domain-containing diguanylate cyclase [Herbaspirillum huttiense]
MNTRYLRTSSSITYFVAAVCLALLLLEVWNSWNARRVQLQDTYSAVGNISSSLAQHANATFKEADIVIAGVSERIRNDGLGRTARQRLHQLLVGSVRELDALNGVFIFDEDGNWIVTSEPTLLTQFNNADREYFQYHRNHPDLMPRIGKPIISRSTGEWVFTISRRISKSDGSFGGVILATINADYFKSFYDRFDIGHDGAVSMGLMSGVSLYRRPLNENSIGRDLTNFSFYQDFILRSNDEVTLIKSPIDGVNRYVSFRRVDNYPLFVVAALSKDEALSGWVGTTMVSAIFVLTALVLVCYFGHRLQMSIKSRELAETRLRHAKRKLATLNRSLSQLALQDGLTTLANRRNFDQTLASEVNRAHRTGSELSVLMIDVDHFKLYNDHYGHPQGDLCLKAIAQAIEDCIKRPGDLAARYGGEEFAVILPGCSKDGALDIALLVCDRIRKLQIPHDGNATKYATVSIGLACMTEPIGGDAGASLLSAADAALYMAKSSGRDKVVRYAPDLNELDLRS